MVGLNKAVFFQIGLCKIDFVLLSLTDTVFFSLAMYLVSLLMVLFFLCFIAAIVIFYTGSYYSNCKCKIYICKYKKAISL